MSELVDSARYELGLDNVEYNRSAQSPAEANLKMVDSLEQVAAAEELVTAITQRAGDEFSKLEAKADRLIANEQKRVTAIARANLVAAEEGVSAERLVTHLALVNACYDAQAAALRNLHPQVQQGTGLMQRFSGQVQNVGYQIGDLAVQIASGGRSFSRVLS